MDRSRVSYFVDEENKVVVAEIDRCSNDATEMLMHKFVSCVTSGLDMYNTYGSKFYMNKKYKAVARLHPEDEWDEKRGCAIACDKLTEKYHNGINKRLAKYAKDFRRIADEIDQYLEKKKFFEKST